MIDLLIRGGRLVDGTGRPGFDGDVAIDGGRIVELTAGRSAKAARREVDARGRVVAPGFVDPHTHYDAQVLWDPALTPSSWHGVTTVVMGNCGFGIAPVRADHHEILLRTLENVEGMSFRALEEGVVWDFDSFPSYLDRVERNPPVLNVGVLVGHTPLRLYVLGAEAVERAATPEEVERMAALVREALAAGALGFATSASPTHVGFGGNPVPSRLSTFDEVKALSSVLGESGRGITEVTPGPGLFVNEMAELARASGRPVTWAALLVGMGAPGFHRQVHDMVAGLHAEGVPVWPQVSCRPLLFEFNFREPTLFETLPAFRKLASTGADRAAAYRDPSFREAFKQNVARAVLLANAMGRTEILATERHAALVDRELGPVAAERGVDVVDLILDLALEDGLATQFRTALVNTDEDEVAKLLASEHTLLGLSDAGAHAGQLCDACYSTHLLGRWVREKKALSLERAIAMLTSQPADLFGIEGRGRLAAGAAADVVVFDPDTVGALPLERVRDLPGGAERLIARARGIDHVFVNGEPIRSTELETTRARPGRLLRHGRAPN